MASVNNPVPALEEPSFSPEYKRNVIILAFGATASMVVGVSSIMPVIPYFSSSFGIDLTTGSMLITAFTMPGILFAPVAGILADRIGRRVLLIPSLILFCLAGSACAFVTDLRCLLALRFLQGVGAAPLGVLNTTILADTFKGPELAKRLGFNMAGLSICTALLPSIGGFLAQQNASLPFLLPLVTLPVIILAIRTPLLTPTKNESFGKYLKGIQTILSQKRPLALLGMTFLTFILLYGPVITCLPALADVKFKASPGIIGSLMIFSSLGAALMSMQLGNFSSRFSAKQMLVCSQICYIVALLLLPQLSPLLLLAIPVGFFGMGQGLNIPTVQNQLMTSVPAPQRAALMAVNGMLLRLGQTIGPVCFSFVFENIGQNYAFYLGIVLALTIAGLAICFIDKN